MKQFIFQILLLVIPFFALGNDCLLKDLAKDRSDYPSLSTWLDANGELGTIAYKIVHKHPTVRINEDVLNDIVAILSSTKLTEAGFTDEMLLNLVDKLDITAYKVLNVGGGANNAIEEMFNTLSSLNNLSAEKLNLIRQGLQKAKPFLYGEIFRLDRINPLDGPIDDVEKYISSPGPPYPAPGTQGNPGSRFADYVRDGQNVECKYYALIAEVSTSSASLGEQIHKDLLSIKNLIQADPGNIEGAFNKFAFEFRKSSKVTSEADMRQQLVDLFYKPEFNQQTTSYLGIKLEDVKNQLNSLSPPIFGMTSQGYQYSDLQSYLLNSPNIRFFD